MRTHNATTKLPFVVSLTLIFSYSLFMAVVPPTVIGIDRADTPLATTHADADPAGLVVIASMANASASDASHAEQ